MVDNKSQNMIKKMKKFETNKGGTGGFTLIEMLIVIAVIAILAGVVLTGVSGFQASARDTRRIGDLRNVQNYLELYFNRCGHYPIDASTCGDADTVEGTVSWENLTTALTTVTSQVPSSPAGDDYEYGYGDDGLSYVLKATFERDNSALDSDIDGSPFGVSCADSAENFFFCIQS